jgi:mannose-6-phosphate isomerase-like protein (cupin superfamily)
MKVKLDIIDGIVIKDNDTYKLEDNNYLKHLTLSTTHLNPGKQTGGHSHKDQEEVYIFTDGNGTMIIGDQSYSAVSGDTFLIPIDTFHQVINLSTINPCKFTCIFEKYDRNSNVAEYKNK